MTGAIRVALGAGAAPTEVLLALPGEYPVCLLGEWAGGGALLTSQPLRTTSELHDLDGPPLPAPEGFVGGGWFGSIDYAGTPRFAYYDHLLRWHAGQWWFEALWTAERADALAARQRDLTAALVGARGEFTVGAFGGADRDEHLAAVERAVEAIRAGELYQVNVCTRLSASFAGDPRALFARAASALRPAYAAYLDGIASLSPELFLRRRGRAVTTRPIKGTRPLDVPPEQLRASAKDAAENVMIVDLMRNDLGRVCEIGSVRPRSLLKVEKHPGVWHLVSTVSGELRDGVGDADLLAATFPPGSVTGAPKSRALTLIDELEPLARQAYTGAVGFVSPAWGVEFNVAIRTFEVAGDRVELGVGGGVTADSVPMLEWRECFDKARPLIAALAPASRPRVATYCPSGSLLEPTRALTGHSGSSLLETILVVDGTPRRLADHLARLDRSARELHGRGIPAELSSAVRDAADATVGTARSVVRVILNADGTYSVEGRPAPPTLRPRPARLVRGRTGLWRHKWADRTYLSAAEAEDEATVPIFVGGDVGDDTGTLLETARGNLFVITADGLLVTPPLGDDLLPGVTRRALLDLARDRGLATRIAALSVDDLRRAQAVFWTSSLSGAVPLTALDGEPLRRNDVRVAEFATALTGSTPPI